MANDFTRMADRVAQLPTAIEQNVDSEMGEVMGSMAKSAQANLTGTNSVATGTLLTRTRHLDDTAPLDLANVTTGYSTHVVRAGTPYAAYHEYGTGLRQGRGTPIGGTQFPAPSNPPVQEILDWMLEKGVMPREYDSMYGAAEAIARDIAAYGTKPHPFMRPAWEEHRQQLSVAHAAGVRRALKRL